MDDEENKPGATQIPLIRDLVFDESLPLRPPRKPVQKSSAARKPTHIPPGYDPDTGDLFDQLDACSPEEDTPETFEPEASEERRQLRLALQDELQTLLKTLES